MKKEINFENVKDLRNRISNYLIEIQNDIDKNIEYDNEHLPLLIHDRINTMFANTFGDEILFSKKY